MRKTYCSERWYPYIEGVYHYQGGGGSPNQWFYSCHDPRYCNYAEDLQGSKGPGWHSCSHSKCVTLQASGPLWHDGQGDVAQNSSWFDYSFQGYAAAVGECADADLESVSSSLSTDMVQELHNLAFQALLPGVKAEMSLPNSIYELKDFRTIGRSIEKIRQAARLFRQRGLTKTSTLRSIQRSAADLSLQVAFNISPLVRDIFSIWKCLKTFEGKRERLLDESGKLLKRHYRRDIRSLFPASTTFIRSFPCSLHDFTHAGYWGSPLVKGPGYGPAVYPPCTNAGSAFTPGVLSRYRSESCELAKYTMTIEYSYSWSMSSGPCQRLAILGDMLGVNLNPSIIWNALPWSFVVDWVLSVSKYLSTYKVSWVRPMVKIHRLCWSIKDKFLVEYAFTKVASAHIAATPFTVCVRKSLSRYNRKVSAFQTQRPLNVDKLDTEEYILAAALVLAR